MTLYVVSGGRVFRPNTAISYEILRAYHPSNGGSKTPSRYRNNSGPNLDRVSPCVIIEL